MVSKRFLFLSSFPFFFWFQFSLLYGFLSNPFAKDQKSKRQTTLSIKIPDVVAGMPPARGNTRLGLSGCQDFMDFIATEPEDEEEEGEKETDSFVSPREESINSFAFFDPSEPFPFEEDREGGGSLTASAVELGVL